MPVFCPAPPFLRCLRGAWPRRDGQAPVCQYFALRRLSPPCLLGAWPSEGLQAPVCQYFAPAPPFPALPPGCMALGGMVKLLFDRILPCVCASSRQGRRGSFLVSCPSFAIFLAVLVIFLVFLLGAGSCWRRLVPPGRPLVRRWFLLLSAGFCPVYGYLVHLRETRE